MRSPTQPELSEEDIAGVPVPEVLAVSADPGWIITGLLPGKPLSEDDSPRARTELGAAIARVHAITGDRFGYTGDRPTGKDWPTAYAAMIDSLRADAAACSPRSWPTSRAAPEPAGLEGSQQLRLVLG